MFLLICWSFFFFSFLRAHNQCYSVLYMWCVTVYVCTYGASNYVSAFCMHIMWWECTHMEATTSGKCRTGPVSFTQNKHSEPCVGHVLPFLYQLLVSLLARVRSVVSVVRVKSGYLKEKKSPQCEERKEHREILHLASEQHKMAVTESVSFLTQLHSFTDESHQRRTKLQCCYLWTNAFTRSDSK